MRALNDVLAFLLELAALAGLVWCGITIEAPIAARVLVGLGGPVAMIVVWARWLAPRSEARLELAGLIATKLVVFGVVVLTLLAAGHPSAATGLGALVIINLGITACFDRP